MSIAEAAPVASDAVDDYRQAQRCLLTEVLTPTLDRLHPGDSYFVGCGVGIEWNPEASDPAARHVYPDWYFVPNAPRLKDGEPRRAFEFWREVFRNMIVIECVTGDGHSERDPRPHRGKFWIYERPLRVISYLIWQPEAQRLDVYEDRHGRLTAQAMTDDGRYWTPEMDCSFGVWSGAYRGIAARWLRAWDRDGNLLPTAAERAAASRPEAPPSRVERLAARLRELGVDPDSV